MEGVPERGGLSILLIGGATMVTFRMNLWIIWMIISVIGITFIGWKQKYVTTNMYGERISVTRIAMVWAKAIIWVSTVIFVVLLVGETFATFQAEEIELTPAVLNPAFVLILLATIFYHVFMCASFNQACREHDIEMRREELDDEEEEEV